MPIIPPSLSWRTVTAVADRLLDPVLDACAAYPQPRPFPQPLNYVGLVYNTATDRILDITDPMTEFELQAFRIKQIESTDGQVNVQILPVLLKSKMRIGARAHESWLSALEETAYRAYEILTTQPEER
jgi:hypothetical protein